MPLLQVLVRLATSEAILLSLSLAVLDIKEHSLFIEKCSSRCNLPEVVHFYLFESDFSSEDRNSPALLIVISVSGLGVIMLFLVH